MPKYTNKDCVRFVRDMREIDIKVYHLHEKFWQGPAVTVSDPEHILENTRVKCNIVQEGMKTVIHPIEGDEGENRHIKAVSVDDKILEEVNFEDEEEETL